MNCFLFLLLLASPKNKQTNKQTNRKNVGRDTAQWLWPIVEGPATNKKKKTKKTRNIKRRSDTKKNYSYIQQVVVRDKKRALLHFKQTDLNECGSSQS